MGAATAARGLLGIDVGGTKVALRAEGGAPGGPVRTEEAVLPWPEARGAAADWAALADAVARLRERWGGDFTAVGVAMPATVGPDGRVLAWPGRPGWEDFGLAPALRELFPAATVGWADDGDLAALAEAVHAGRDHLVYLGVGTGVGGGVVHRGAPLPGPSRGSCEAGHLIVDRGGPRCDCGRHGCLQATASGPATLRRAALLRGAPVGFAELRAALAGGEPWAEEAVEETCSALAAAAVSLAELFHPELTVVGGGFADGLPGFAARVEAHAAALARPGGPAPAIRPAALGGLSSLHGAVALARRQPLGEPS
ncbi:ROK family protein [Kitasatospora sp. NPDC058201]|uniref:ROK family protein n=1 Tax=Streptomycetaceae TaxID=2062 RepID=UPI002E79692E|nr:ROK family protein [Streptomyces sp. BE303]MED7954525.1 ROK family protein [Streptomyces sp. BE303]